MTPRGRRQGTTDSGADEAAGGEGSKTAAADEASCRPHGSVPSVDEAARTATAAMSRAMLQGRRQGTATGACPCRRGRRKARGGAGAVVRCRFPGPGRGSPDGQRGVRQGRCLRVPKIIANRVFCVRDALFLTTGGTFQNSFLRILRYETCVVVGVGYLPPIDLFGYAHD